MAWPPEIVTWFSWLRSPGAIVSAQLQDRVCGGMVTGNAVNFRSGRRVLAAGLWRATLREGVESWRLAGKRGDNTAPGIPIFPGNSGSAYRKLSPGFAPRKSALNTWHSMARIVASSPCPSNTRQALRSRFSLACWVLDTVRGRANPRAVMPRVGGLAGELVYVP